MILNDLADQLAGADWGGWGERGGVFLQGEFDFVLKVSTFVSEAVLEGEDCYREKVVPGSVKKEVQKFHDKGWRKRWCESSGGGLYKKVLGVGGLGNWSSMRSPSSSRILD